MADYIRRPLEYIEGDSTVTKPLNENWLVNGMFWWEPDTNDWYHYLEATETDPAEWEKMNIQIAAGP